jgi:tetratricopeptide (TPR) repeat protein
LSLDLSACLLEMGRLGEAEERVAGVARSSADIGDERLAAHASVQLWDVRSSSQNLAGWKSEALRDAEQAVATFTRLGDELGLAKALQLRALIHQVDYEFARADFALEEALEHARRAGNQQQEVQLYYGYARSAVWGPTHVEEALRRQESFMRRFDGNRLVEAECVRNMAALEAMRGNFDAARHLLDRSSGILSELGATLRGSGSVVPGIVELLAGDAVAAEERFRASYAALGRAGERNARATAAAYLARALYAQGRYDDAERFTTTSERLAASDDEAARVEWSTTRAKILALEGRHDEADLLSSEAAALAARMDDVEAQAHALLDRAEVMRIGGRPRDARALVTEAVDVLERKGNVVGASHARRLLGDPAIATSR